MDPLADLELKKEVYDYISFLLRCLQNVDEAAQDIVRTVGKLNIKVAVNILMEEMMKEERPGKTNEQASSVLLALANYNFNAVMYELQRNVRTGTFPHLMVFRTLANLASRYALKSIPFLSLTFLYIRLMLRLPIISQMKEEVCYVMENFCTAINYYYKHWKMCSFPREAESQLCGPVMPIYQRLVGDWLMEEESKVKEALVRAQWPMLGVLVRRKEQQDEIIRNVPQVLQDSRTLDNFLVAKRLNLFLDVCEECETTIPRKIFQTLCDFVMKEVIPLGNPVQQSKRSQKIVERFAYQPGKLDTQRTTVEDQIQDGGSSLYDLTTYHHQEASMDHHNLLIDAFGHLVSCCPVDALDFLQTFLRNDSEQIRVGFLKNLKMIVGNDEVSGSRKRKRPVVEAVKCLLDDHREAVRKATLAFIKELLRSQNVEGCAVWDMVAYVFGQFTIPLSQTGKDAVAEQKEREKEERIQGICIDVLEHLNTSAEGMSKALWPKLLLFVVPAPYTPTLTPLCRCLKEFALMRQDESTLFLGSCKGVNLPSPQGLVARLLVLASNPNQRGGWALQLLHALHKNIHVAIRNLWAKQIPFLWEFFQEQTHICSPEWEQKLLQFLRRSLKTIDDDVWTENLSRQLENQMNSYADQSTEKSFLYKSLGISLATCENFLFVQSQLQHLIETTNYMEASGRERVIQTLSFSAIGHLDLTLATLHEFGAGMSLKMKMSAIINRYKDYHRGRRDHVHQTLMLTYGKVALQAPKELLFPRVESDMLKKVLYHYRKSCQVLGVSFENKDGNLKMALVESTADICHAIHETRDFKNFQLGCKRELLDILLDFIEEEPLDSLDTPLRFKAITAIAIMNKLKPTLTMEEVRSLLDQSIKSLFPLPPLEQLKERAEAERNAVETELLYICSMEAFGKLIKNIIEEHPTSELMEEIFQLTDPWFTETECSRERALQATFQALAAFEEAAHLPPGENFPPFGARVALLAPYTCDSSFRCRQWASQCITCLLHIQANTRLTSEAEEEMLSACGALQTKVPSNLFRASSRMAKVVSAYFPPEQALDFIQVILEVLVAGHEMCAVGAGHWLLTILQDCGSMMEFKISEILDVFYSRLPTIKQEELRQVLVSAVSIVARYHLDTVFTSLLRRRLPMDSETGELWRSLGKDPSLASLILCKLASKITQPRSPEATLVPSCEETVEFADEETLKGTCAIYEVLSVVQAKEIIQPLFPELFCTLLWQVSKTLGQKMPFQEGRRRLFLREQQLSEGNPCRLSVASLKALVLKLACGPSLGEIREVSLWALLRDPSTHHEGVGLLTRCLLENKLLDHKIIHTVQPWMASGSEKLRLTGTAFFAEAIQDPVFREREQLKSVLSLLIKRAGDQHPAIRQMGVKGLGNAFLTAPEKVKEHKKAIVAVFLGALYDTRVVLESLRALALVLPHLKGKEVGFLFKDLCVKIATYLSNDDAEIREAALHVFGILAGWTKFKHKTFFAGQVRKNLVSLLIHQQDPNPKVSETCRATFLQSVRFVAKRKLRTHVEELYRTTSLSPPNLHMHICRQMVSTNGAMRQELLHRTVVYFHSSWEEIQARAVELAGIILESMQLPELDETSRQLVLISLGTLQERSSHSIQQAAGEVAAYIIKKWGGSRPRRSQLSARESNSTQKLAADSTTPAGMDPKASCDYSLYE